MRDLHDTLKNRIRALEALGEKPMTHSCILLPMLETKLPPELSEKWELELTDIKEESVDLELFSKFLNKQVISKEAGERDASMIGENGETARGSGGRDKDGTGVKNTREKVFSAAALLASGKNRKSYAACRWCKEQGHETLKCPVLKLHGDWDHTYHRGTKTDNIKRICGFIKLQDATNLITDWDSHVCCRRCPESTCEGSV